MKSDVLVANIQGGTEKYVSKSTVHVLDGSQSYDNNVPPDHANRHFGFLYEW